MSSDLQPQALRAQALESLLVERGLLEARTVDAVIDRYQNRVGPLNGAKVIVRAWLEPEFRRKLLVDAGATVAEYQFEGGEIQKLLVVENTATVHNVIVCTLCSCYPWAMLGLPPAWYKDPAYRSRIVREPRATLAEMGLDLPPDVEIRVWDSSAEIRYMVLPRRPEGTEGWDFEHLLELVGRESMIGVALARSPRDRARSAGDEKSR